MSKFNEWLKRFKQGDVIAGEVGENSHGVVIGKNIIQIGTLVIPVMPTLFLIVAVISVSLWVMWPQPGLKEMQGQFNIAVAEFGQLDSNGQVQSSTDGKNLSRWVYQQLQDEYADLDLDVVVEIWQNSREDLDVSLGPIFGGTPEERHEAAKALAGDINAHLIIYGNLSITGDSANFVPEFYISELNEAEELIGPYQLGTAIPIRLPISKTGNTLQVNSQMQTRSQVLTLFTIGLALESYDKQQALDTFREAAQLPGWENNEGKEVVALFIGREAFFLWEAGKGDEQAVIDAFQEALDINDDYGRAHIGLGNFYQQKAELVYQLLRPLLLNGQSPLTSLPLAQQVDEFLQYINQAMNHYQKALELASVTPDGQVDTKAYLGLGNTYNRLGGLYVLLNEYQVATGYFNQATEQNQKVLSLGRTDDYRHLGQAELGIGRAYHQIAHIYLLQNDEANSKIMFNKAIEAYAACTAQADAEASDWFLQRLKVDYCMPNNQAAEQAVASLPGG